MTPKANILVTRRKDAYRIKVEGRATFECSPPLRNLVNNITPEGVHQVTVDLANCSGMDSTFMGVLAMIAMRSRTIGTAVQVIGCSTANRHLLDGLGLKKLFAYLDAEAAAEEPDDWDATPETSATPREQAETVLDAHETLIQADPANQARFGNVVKLVRDDLANLTD